MLKSADISIYQPVTVRGYREFKEIANRENEALTDCWGSSNSVFLDQFIETLTENGCRRWEKILNIQPKDTDTLQVRRFRIKSRINEDLPYTWRALENVLNSLCGEGQYEMTLYNDEYRLKILLELTVKELFNEVESTVKRIIPANLILDVELRYNQYITLGKYTHGELRPYRHWEIREAALQN
jgi:hypothetical protein